MPQPWTFKSNRSAGKAPRLENGYRSGLEKRIADDLTSRDVPFQYETVKVQYTVPSRDAKYTPDFILPNGIIIEAKGIFDVEDRQKHVLVKAQNPELDIRFVFSSANKTIYKTSKTTYAQWCVEHGFKYAEKLVPIEWTKEPK